MKTQTRWSGALALLLLATSQAFAYSISTSLFYLPGNNVYYTKVPDPTRPGVLMDGVAILRTEAEMAQGVTTYSGLPAGSFNAAAGITVLVPLHYSHTVDYFNAMGLTVGPEASAVIQEAGVFTDVFGVYAEDTFGFAGIHGIEGFGMTGAPITFAFDRYHSLNANRFLTAAAISAGYRNAYTSTPLLFSVPDAGGTLLMLSAALGLLMAWVMRDTWNGTTGPR